MDDIWVRSIFFGVLRWAHLAAAVVAIGGSFVLRYVVLPAMAEDDAERQKGMHGRMRQRLAPIVMTAVGLLIVSGVANIFHAFMRPPTPPVIYMIVLTVKMLGAAALFCFALMLVIPSSPPNAFQRRRKFWLSMNCHLGFLLIAVSVALGYLSGK